MAVSETKHHLSVHCVKCDATVKGEVIALRDEKYYESSGDVYLPDNRVSIVACPSCDQTLVVREEWQGEGDYGDIWSKPIRIWPAPERNASTTIPKIVAISLSEAQLCHRAGAYTSCAVMCGRALEGICIHFKTKDKILAKGLQELLARKIIDARLAEWSDSLRVHRNLGAHASEDKISKQDATDLLDFLLAICEYVFVLTPKYQSFLERKKKMLRTKPSPDGT